MVVSLFGILFFYFMLIENWTGLGLCSQGWGVQWQVVSGKPCSLVGRVRFYEKGLHDCRLLLRAEGWSVEVSADGPQGSHLFTLCFLLPP